MRDWLALPLNSNDEQGDINKKNERAKEGLSAWFSILSIFGNASKKVSSSSSSNRSIDHCPTRNNNACKQDLVDDEGEEASDHEETLSIQQDKLLEELLNIEQELSDHEQELSDDEEALFNFEQELLNPEHEQAPVHDGGHSLVRTFSASSIASSVETEPASTDIMGSPHHKYNTMTNVKIYWNHGGKKVQVTGEFDNWSVSVDMVQDCAENRHVTEIPMDLTRDIEYKFIVDGEWRYASDLPHRTDWRGNVNNVIYKQTS